MADTGPEETPLSRLRSIFTHMKLAAEMASIEMKAAGGERLVLAIGYENADASGQFTGRLDLGLFLDDLEKVLSAKEMVGSQEAWLNEIYAMCAAGKIHGENDSIDAVVGRLFHLGEDGQWDVINTILAAVDAERCDPTTLVSFLVTTFPMRHAVPARKKLLASARVILEKTETPEEFEQLMAVLDHDAKDVKEAREHANRS